MKITKEVPSKMGAYRVRYRGRWHWFFVDRKEKGGELLGHCSTAQLFNHSDIGKQIHGRLKEDLIKGLEFVKVPKPKGTE